MAWNKYWDVLAGYNIWLYIPVTLPPNSPSSEHSTGMYKVWVCLLSKCQRLNCIVRESNPGRPRCRRALYLKSCLHYKKRLNKARPLCDLIKLNTILAQEYVTGKASTGTHVSSDLLNTGRFYMALCPPTGILTSRLRGYLSSTTSRGHLGTTYMVSPKDKYRDI